MKQGVLRNILASLAFLLLIGCFSGLPGSKTDLRPAIRQFPELVGNVQSLPHIHYTYAGRPIDNRRDPVTFIYMSLRKGGHFFLYGLFGFFLANASAASGVRGIRRWVLAGAVVLTVACLDEWNQSHIAGRSRLIQDVLLDLAGFVAVAPAARFFQDKIFHSPKC